MSQDVLRPAPRKPPRPRKIREQDQDPEWKLRDLLGTRDVADMLEVTVETVRVYLARSETARREGLTAIGKSAPLFPPPVTKISNRPAWRREDILAWQAARPGRGSGLRPGSVADPKSQLRKMIAEITAETGVRPTTLTAWQLAFRVLRGFQAQDISAMAQAGMIPLTPIARENRGARERDFKISEIRAWFSASPDPNAQVASLLEPLRELQLKQRQSRNGYKSANRVRSLAGKIPPYGFRRVRKPYST